MISLFLAFISTSLVVFKDRRDLTLEILALRQQLIVYKRLQPRLPLQPQDRLFWVWLSKIWGRWRHGLIIVKPETVINWHRKGFRLFWTKISQRKRVGRPAVSPQVRASIKQMAEANPLWGAPRIHGELLKLGFDISERTVSRLMPKRSQP
ncbi:MAG: helix-turn-helix domain-containing protein, partial [Acidobacteriota bacterium]|nr:helix-turn-helix domain-containing protein [Acidobacteriota bacterium]